MTDDVFEKGKAMKLTSTIEWHPIETIPHGERIFVADMLDRVLVTAIAEVNSVSGETLIHAAGYPVTGTKWWTNWAYFPELPRHDSLCNEASRVQKLLAEQNAEIDRLKNRIEQLEAANLKASLIKLDDMARIEKLEAALLEVAELGMWDGNCFRAFSRKKLAMCVELAEDALKGKKDD